MIRFHMLYNQVIRFAAIQNLLQVIEPFVRKVCVYRIHDCHFLIKDHVGIIGHAVWNLILSLEKVYLMVVYTCIFDGICDFHMISPSLFVNADNQVSAGLPFYWSLNELDGIITTLQQKICCKYNKISVFF